MCTKINDFKVFMILYVKLSSGFENWDIQDLTLREYDKTKQKENTKKLQKNI